MTRNRLFLTLFVLISTIVFQSARASEIGRILEKVNYRSFRGAQISCFQNTRSYFTGGALWTPWYPIADGIKVGIDLGASLLALRTQNIFIAPEYVLKGQYEINSSFSVDAGIGAQTWIGNGGTFLQLEANGAYHLPEKWLSVVEQVFVGYAFINSSERSTHEIRVGAGIEL